MSTAAAPRAADSAPKRVWSLALSFQEVFTAVVRLRYAGQGVTNAAAFREHLKQALQVAHGDAQNYGYNVDDVRRATFAVVAYVDESVLNSRNPAFSDWARMPLQEEFYGGHVGGELFFRDLQSVLERPDSRQTADLLEVYYLCMLLGYRGRYGAGGSGELSAILSRIRDKIRRIRGEAVVLSPRSDLPPETAPPPRTDPWIRRLAFAAIGIAVVCLLMFGVMKLRLSAGASDVHALAAQSHS